MHMHRHMHACAAQVRCAVRVAVERAPLCLKGRYMKFSRALPQTPWIMEGERKRANSVQECIEAAALRLYGSCEAHSKVPSKVPSIVPRVGSTASAVSKCK